ncbi:CAP domain-containing protein [Streptomyces hainanensis]|uniref:CAP domain-containing protein n=1 Tax=Streptomyces hainanensis TaxID=402648 RepID=A0A4R4TX01_9ACTN|nr:CAP domain-containing protein [Streptomyces hainanensis]TDC79783.1 CAP domain-containing protein [Streptomyces hainanensis]
MGRHRRRRGHARTGLVGASAALTVGAVAVGSGLLPGLGQGFGLNNEPDDVQAQDQRASTRPSSLTPSPSTELGGQEERTPEEDPGTEPAEETTRPDAESPSPSPEESSAPPTTEAPEPTPDETESTTPAPTTPSEEAEQSPTSPPSASEEPTPSTAPETAMAEAVLTLVNEERANAGCQPLTLDTGLSRLAADFSLDMANRGFFDHTDPDGLTPWDRALTAGIANLGGENIARGQQDAQAVMDAWMDSEGHRENILNCEFRTLGVGVHLGDGGPWWTQDFGY